MLVHLLHVDTGAAAPRMAMVLTHVIAMMVTLDKTVIPVSIKAHKPLGNKRRTGLCMHFK